MRPDRRSSLRPRWVVPALLTALLGLGAAQAHVQSASVPIAATAAATQNPTPSSDPSTDPWPSAPVLTRLFALPSGQSSGERLRSDLRLSAAQVQVLRELAAQEAALAHRAERVIGRANAAALSRQIGLFNADKDRRVRATLGATYPRFRQWVRAWWRGEVTRATRPGVRPQPLHPPRLFH